jgi:hypothetical protein
MVESEADVASAKTTAGGWGRGEYIQPSDWRLVRQAIAEGWPVPEAVRRQIVARAHESIDAERKRMRLATLRAIISMEAQNVGLRSELWPTQTRLDELPDG